MCCAAGSCGAQRCAIPQDTFRRAKICGHLGDKNLTLKASMAKLCAHLGLDYQLGINFAPSPIANNPMFIETPSLLDWCLIITNLVLHLSKITFTCRGLRNVFPKCSFFFVKILMSISVLDRNFVLNPMVASKLDAQRVYYE